MHQPDRTKAAAQRAALLFFVAGLLAVLNSFRGSPGLPGASSTFRKRQLRSKPHLALQCQKFLSETVHLVGTPGNPREPDFIRRLQEAGSKFLVLTNNSLYTP